MCHGNTVSKLCLFPYRNCKSPCNSVADNPDFLELSPASRALKEPTRRSRDRWGEDVSPSVKRRCLPGRKYPLHRSIPGDTALLVFQR